MLKQGDGTEVIIKSIKFDQDIPPYLFNKAALKTIKHKAQEQTITYSQHNTYNIDSIIMNVFLQAPCICLPLL